MHHTRATRVSHHSLNDLAKFTQQQNAEVI